MYCAFRCQDLYCSLPDTFLYYVRRQKPGSRVGERVLGGDKRREKNRTWDTASQKRETFGASPIPRRPSLCSNVRLVLALVLEKPRVHQHPTRKTLEFQIRMVRGGRIRDSFQRCGRTVGKSQRTVQSPEFKKQSCPPLGPLGRGVRLLLGVGESHGEDHLWRTGWGGGAQSAPGDPTGRGPLPREDPYLAKPGFRARAPPGLQQACGWGAQ